MINFFHWLISYPVFKTKLALQKASFDVNKPKNRDPNGHRGHYVDYWV